MQKISREEYFKFDQIYRPFQQTTPSFSPVWAQLHTNNNFNQNLKAEPDSGSGGVGQLRPGQDPCPGKTWALKTGTWTQSLTQNPDRTRAGLSSEPIRKLLSGGT